MKDDKYNTYCMRVTFWAAVWNVPIVSWCIVAWTVNLFDLDADEYLDCSISCKTSTLKVFLIRQTSNLSKEKELCGHIQTQMQRSTQHTQKIGCFGTIQTWDGKQTRIRYTIVLCVYSIVYANCMYIGVAIKAAVVGKPTHTHSH